MSRFTPSVTPFLFCILISLSLATQAYSSQKDIIDNKDSVLFYLQKTHFEHYPDATAVILYEKGDALLYHGVLSYKIERTIKILSQDAANQAGSVILPALGAVSFNKISGITYNLDNGVLVKQEVDKADIIKDKVTDHASVLKFNFPSLKAGSILHYSYTIEAFAFANMPDWNFQHEYPTLYSEYDMSLPSYYTFMHIARSDFPLTEVKKKSALDTMEGGSYSEPIKASGQANTIWIRRHIAALKNEPYRLGDNQYLERIRVQFTSIGHEPLLNTWDQVCKSIFLEGKNYIYVYDNNNFLGETVDKLTAGKTSALDKAKAVFAFMRDSFALDEDKKVYQLHLHNTFNIRRGTQWELCLLTTAMLRRAGFESDPVLIAAKPAESLSAMFPDIQNINYYITKVTIEQKDYYLDATQKYLPFGVLLPKCYNGYGRVMCRKSYGVQLSPDDLTDRNVIMATLGFSSETEHTLQLKLDKQFGQVSSFQYRKKWNGDQTKAKKELKAAFEADKFHLIRVNIDNFSDPDKPLTIHYEAEAELSHDALLYMNLYFDKFFKDNPFPSVHRRFPVNLDYQL
ncbi:MAG TPA: DUF3857 domain-containing protein, partial [Arachidicoccus sp.]|nr:DUF3857 domain-containing protein [Arachidicoccus sp.]